MSGFGGDIVISSGARRGIKRAMFGKSTAGRVSSVRRAAAAITKAAITRARAPTRRRYAPSVRNARTGGFLGIELKFVDYGVSARALTAPADAAGGEVNPTATSVALNSIAQGDAENQRDGKQAMVKSCYVNGMIIVPALADQADAYARQHFFVALVLDTQCNGVELNSEDVFANPSGTAICASSPLRDLQYSKRFRVLDSVQLTGGAAYAQTDGASTASIAGASIPFKLSYTGDIPINFNATTATIAAITDNCLQVIAYATSTVAGPTISYNSRVRFVG